jgi:uridylate kinase
MQPKYKRVLLKISGEALAGSKKTGIDFDIMQDVCSKVKECVDLGVQIALVVGAGNFWRGRQGTNMDRTRADHMGMLATVMNSLALADTLEQMGVPTRVMTAIEMRQIAEPYIRNRAVRHLEKGRVVIFGCGTGNPFFSTDTATVLRAVEIDAEIVLLAKNIDSLYTADPNKDPNAVRIEAIRHIDILKKGLAVIDSTATSLSMDNDLPILIFGLDDTRNIIRAVMGEKIGTIVKGEIK